MIHNNTRNYAYQMLKHRRNLFFVLALSGCSLWSDPEQWSAEEQQEKIAEYSEQGGYRAPFNYTMQTLRETWMHGNEEVDIAFSSPDQPGVYPLIVYLPGLGETAAAGELWRQAWIAAGYAVFSAQPVELKEALHGLPPPAKNSSEKRSFLGFSGPSESRMDDAAAVRESELHYLGRKYFASAELQRRLKVLAWSLHELHSRSKDPASRFAAADFSRLVIAGYDLGAQTAAAVAGENTGAAVPSLGAWQPKAAIVLSPAVDLAGGSIRGRFKNISLPLLAITGTADEDPYGISSASVRTVLWDYAASSDKYLLQLQYASHRLLAGSNKTLKSAPFLDNFPTDDRGDISIGPSPKAFRGGANSFKQVAIVSSVSTAFLDAVIRSDLAARQWLDNKAAKWIGKTGQLKRK